MQPLEYEPLEPRGGDMRSLFRFLLRGVTVLNIFLTIGIIIALAFLFRRTYYTASTGDTSTDGNTTLGGALDGTIAHGKVRDYLTTFGVMCPEDRRPVDVYFHANGSLRSWSCALYDDIPIPPGGVLAGTLGNASFALVGPFVSYCGPGYDINITYFGTPYPLIECTERPPTPDPIVNVYHVLNDTTNTTADGVIVGPLNATQFAALPTPGVVDCTGFDTRTTYVEGQIWSDAECVPRPPTAMGGVIVGLSNETLFADYPTPGVVNCSGADMVATNVEGDVFHSFACVPRTEPNVTVSGPLMQGPLSNLRFLTGPEAGTYGGFEKDCTLTISDYHQLTAINCSTRPMPTFEENSTIILVEANVTLAGDVIGDPDDNELIDRGVTPATYRLPCDLTLIGKGLVVGDPTECVDAFVNASHALGDPAYFEGNASALTLINYGVAGTHQADGTLSVYTTNDAGLVTGVTRGSDAVIFNTTIVGGPVIGGTHGDLTFLEGPATALYGGADQDCAFNVSNRFVTNISCVARAAYDPETIVLAGDVEGSPGANALIDRGVTAHTYRLPCDLTLIGKGLVTDDPTECVDAFVNASHALGNPAYFEGNASALTLIDYGVAGTYQSDGTLSNITVNDAGIVTAITRGSDRILFNTTVVGGTELTGTFGDLELADAGFPAGSCGNSTHTVGFIAWTDKGLLAAAPACASYVVIAGDNETEILGTVNQINVNSDTPGLVVLSAPQDLHTAADFQVASITATTAAHVGPITSRLGLAQHTVTHPLIPSTEYYRSGGSGYPILQMGAYDDGVDPYHWLYTGAYIDASGVSRVGSALTLPTFIYFYGGSTYFGSASAGTPGAPMTGEINHMRVGPGAVALDSTVRLFVYGTLYAGSNTYFGTGTAAGNNQFLIMGTSSDTTTFAQIEFKNAGAPHANLHLAAVDTTRQFLAFGGYRTGGSYRVGATTDDVFVLERDGNTFSLQYLPPGAAGGATTPVLLQAQTRSLAYVTTPFEARATFRAGPPTTYAGSNRFVLFGPAQTDSPPVLDFVPASSTYATAQMGTLNNGNGFLAFDMAWDEAANGHVITSATYGGILFSKIGSGMGMYSSSPGTVGTLATLGDLAYFDTSEVRFTPRAYLDGGFHAGVGTTYAGVSPFVLFGAVAADTAPMLDFVVATKTLPVLQIGVSLLGTGLLTWDVAYITDPEAYLIGSATVEGKILSKLGGDLVMFSSPAGTVGLVADLTEIVRFASTATTFTPMTNLLGGFRAGPTSTRSGINKYSIGGDATIHLEIYATGQTQPRGNAYAFVATGNAHVAFDCYHDGTNYRFASGSQACLLLRKTADTFAVQFNPAATTPTLGGALTPQTRFSVTSAATTVHNGLLVEPSTGAAHVRLRLPGDTRPRTEYASFAAANHYTSYDIYWESGTGWVTTSVSTPGFLVYKSGSTFSLLVSPAQVTIGTAVAPVSVWSASSTNVLTITNPPIISAWSAAPHPGRLVQVGTGGVLQTSSDTSYETGVFETGLSTGSVADLFSVAYTRLGNLVSVQIFRAGTTTMTAGGTCIFLATGTLPITLRPTSQSACGMVGEINNPGGVTQSWLLRVCVGISGSINICPMAPLGTRLVQSVFDVGNAIALATGSITYQQNDLA